MKDGGFNYFLLLFYGTVVGLEPGLVGLAILIALVLDAVSDPLVGYWSDNFRSRWGRRHPFMYAAAIPVAASYYMLWNPPDWSQGALFAYLLGLAVLIRTFITFYETPSSALLPELSSDYEERTSLQTYRLFFGWTGGNAMTVLMFGALLVPTAVYSHGILNREGYATYGVIASVLIFAAIMISALGTHRNIPQLREAPVNTERFSLRKLFGEMFETLSEKSFFALFVATLLGSVATGVAASLAFIMLTYFWGFSTQQQFIWTALVFFSALISFFVAPFAVKRAGKRRAVIILGLIAFTVAPAPVLLRLFGLMPENGDPMLFPLIATINTLDLSLIIALQAVLYSMIADLVESSELRTGRRSEGVFYAAVTFTRKCTVGLGSFVGGIILSIVAIPKAADPSDVTPDKLWLLGAFYAPTLLALWMGMIYAISRYKISKEEHEENLRKLSSQGT
ncbi:sugar transporter [Erythrobacter litoralis HTCC2594]|uniref:Sugar transporter n=1 Tax=Erythrobacter litoralis (strain HTCC2594) TaxID=314225 RepID=Q2NB13_ERYLH|nr:sugar transporter [Erythrobacter litoralis HTCC2594]